MKEATFEPRYIENYLTSDQIELFFTAFDNLGYINENLDYALPEERYQTKNLIDKTSESIYIYPTRQDYLIAQAHYIILILSGNGYQFTNNPNLKSNYLYRLPIFEGTREDRAKKRKELQVLIDIITECFPLEYFKD